MDSTLKLTDSQLDAWCHAALVLGKKIGIGSKKANKELLDLLMNFGSIRNVYQHFYSMLPVEQSIINKLDATFSKLKFDFGVITVYDSEYPFEIKNIDGVPPIYYYRGDLNTLKLKKSISFVGTRELDNPEHIRQAKNAIKRMCDAGYQVIVSGLAKGADTLGHKTAMELGMKTIAILGTPLNVSYPAENKELQEKIATEHLILTEYPVGVNSLGAYFANRNLTTVSLSYEGVVVARAGDKSGTQYAIRSCIEQNKTLYVLENNIYEKEYEWVVKYKPFIKVIKERK